MYRPRDRELSDIATELDTISTSLTALGYVIVDGGRDSDLTASGIEDVIFSTCCHIDRIAEELDYLDRKLAFIKARSEGKSYDTIAKELDISKGTCNSWEHLLREDIDAMKRAKTEELYTAYNMKREARIKALGDILQSLDKAIANRPLEDIPTEKLLELRLKYGRELKTEYIEPVEIDTDNTLDGLLEDYNKLYRDSKTGKYSPADIKAQLAILDAKRATLVQAEGERQKEDNDPFSLEYKSGLIRREA